VNTPCGRPGGPVNEAGDNEKTRQNKHEGCQKNPAEYMMSLMGSSEEGCHQIELEVDQLPQR